MENEQMTPIPEQPQAQPPVEPQYQKPFEPQYQQPAQPQYQQPAQPQYQQPAQPQYQQPAQPQYQQPAQPQYQQPVQPQYQQPAQPQYQQPVQPPQYWQPYGQPYGRPYAQPQEPPKKKSKRWKILLPVIAVVLALAALACVYFFVLRAPSVETVALSEDALYLKQGDAWELRYTYEPADAGEFDCEWSTDDASVAAVKDGRITAVGAGECTITLRADGAAADCRVTVVAPPAEGADIVGTWRFDGAFIDDVYYSEANCALTVFVDNRAELVIDGETTGLSWSVSSAAEGWEYFDATADDGTVSEFWYCNGSDKDYAGKLVLYGDENNMFIFKK